MKKANLVLIVSLLILSCSQKQKSDDDIQKEMNTESAIAQKLIDSSNKRIETFYKNKLADSIVAQMADDVIQFPPNNKPLEGKDSIKNYWQQLFQFGDVDFTLQTQKVVANGPLAVEWGKYSVKFTALPNSPVPDFNDSGNYVVYYKKVNGIWKAVWDAPVSTVPLH